MLLGGTGNMEELVLLIRFLWSLRPRDGFEEEELEWAGW